MGKLTKILLVMVCASFLAISDSNAGDVEGKLSDSAGGSKFVVKDKTGNEKFSVSSDGSVTINNKYKLPNDSGTQGQIMKMPPSGGSSAPTQLIWGSPGYPSGMGVGGSSLTNYLYDEGLFDLHTIDDAKHGCMNGGGWSFVNIVRGKGFCIENVTHEKKEFEDALKTCMNAGARLPEPVEWTVAYKRLNFQTIGEYEWVSNFTFRDIMGINIEAPDVPITLQGIPMLPQCIGDVIECKTQATDIGELVVIATPKGSTPNSDQDFNMIAGLLSSIKGDKSYNDYYEMHFRCVK